MENSMNKAGGCRAWAVAASLFTTLTVHGQTVLTTFETPEVPGTPASTGSTLFSQTAVQFPNWMASGGVPGWSANGAVNLGEVGSANAASAGQQFLYLSSGDVASYTFSGLTTGVAYSLAFSFEYSGAASAATTTAGTFSILEGSKVLVGPTALVKDTPTGSSANTYFANLGPAPAQKLDFIASGSNLSFVFAVSGAAGTGNDHLAIDNVSVAVAAQPIPEPGSYALMLAGLCAVGFVAARRRPTR